MSKPVGTSAYGQVLTELAAELGIKQSEVCRRTNLSSSYVSQLFSGRISDPLASRLYLVAHALGTTTDEVIARVASVESK